MCLKCVVHEKWFAGGQRRGSMGTETHLKFDVLKVFMRNSLQTGNVTRGSNGN